MTDTATRTAYLRDRQAALRYLMEWREAWRRGARCKSYADNFAHLRRQLDQAIRDLRGEITVLGWELSEAPDFSSAYEGGQARKQAFEENEALSEDRFLKSICH